MTLFKKSSKNHSTGHPSADIDLASSALDDIVKLAVSIFDNPNGDLAKQMSNQESMIICSTAISLVINNPDDSVVMRDRISAEVVYELMQRTPKPTDSMVEKASWQTFTEDLLMDYVLEQFMLQRPAAHTRDVQIEAEQARRERWDRTSI